MFTGDERERFHAVLLRVILKGREKSSALVSTHPPSPAGLVIFALHKIHIESIVPLIFSKQAAPQHSGNEWMLMCPEPKPVHRCMSHSPSSLGLAA